MLKNDLAADGSSAGKANGSTLTQGDPQKKGYVAWMTFDSIDVLYKQLDKSIQIVDGVEDVGWNLLKRVGKLLGKVVGLLSFLVLIYTVARYFWKGIQPVIMGGLR